MSAVVLKAKIQEWFILKQTEEKAEASEDVDLFASDDEAVEAPVRVKPSPKPKAAPKKPEATKSKAASKMVAEAPTWPNKAECNDAESKFQAELSKVADMSCVCIEFTCVPIHSP